MIRIYSPKDEVELAILKGIFESEGIPIFVHNDHFGSMRTGLQIELFNKKTIMVSEQHAGAAQRIVQEFVGNLDGADCTGQERKHFSVWDKVRMVAEALIFGWVMAGRKWRRPGK